MNSLSLLIYAIGVLDNVGNLLGISIFLTVLSCGVVATMWGNNALQDKTTISYGKRALAWIVIASVIIAFLPSKQTMTLIAASEVGERVIKTEAGQSVVEGAKGAMKDLSGLGSESVGLLRAYIQKQTQDLQKDIKK